MATAIRNIELYALLLGAFPDLTLTLRQLKITVIGRREQSSVFTLHPVEPLSKDVPRGLAIKITTGVNDATLVQIAIDREAIFFLQNASLAESTGTVLKSYEAVVNMEKMVRPVRYEVVEFEEGSWQSAVSMGDSMEAQMTDIVAPRTTFGGPQWGEPMDLDM
ncbi:hypothetical protein G7046_g6125 [Stylonectria norvegica]|nr:hypothetical protein G7046_g6125 [Stylonectria norvegica]